MNNTTLTQEKEMELINSYTRKPLTPQEVYTFTITLCDNETDRDYQCFTVSALEKLAELFVGKTGISDHSMRSRDQAARIYYCYIERHEDKKTTYGEAYTALKAKAYTLRTKANENLIAEIDGGIKKEVSIGCSVAEEICSICGNDIKKDPCRHIKGRYYKSKLCYGILREPTDAYEWSFVAVPAQKNAGVSKAFKTDVCSVDGSIMKTLSPGCTLSDDSFNTLSDYISSLEALAKQAMEYKQHLGQDIVRYTRIIMPEVSTKDFSRLCSDMELSALRKLRDDMKKQAFSILPASTQLKAQSTSKQSNTDFII